MRAIMVMFDSLNRHMLPPYGNDWVHAPNFKRLAERTVTFDRSFVGSMPCMPARRELHTGRYNFLHRSWGPLEPFDDSMPELLKQNGVPNHLVSDHYHYWEEGGCTYHTRHSNWRISRGQEGDPCFGDLRAPDIPIPNPHAVDSPWKRQDWVNRAHMQKIEEQPQAKTFAMGEEFIHANHTEDRWFLQLETFDPHEPYFCDRKYRELYPHDYDGPEWDWPAYAPVSEETRPLIEHARCVNAALVTMCDEHLGRVLDLMDCYDMWRDTMLIVNTDHGFLLGEHDWWGKCRMPFYNEIALTPLFIWDPRSGKAGERRKHLVQTIDLPATLLEYFGIDLPRDMQGRPLRQTIENNVPVRTAGLFGLHGGHVNVTDGRYVYMRAPATPDNGPLFEYTHMPSHMRRTFSLEEMRETTLQAPFSFTKGCPVMKIPGRSGRGNLHRFGNLLFDIEADPEQGHPLRDRDIETRMIRKLVPLMQANDAPPEQFERLGLLRAQA